VRERQVDCFVGAGEGEADQQRAHRLIARAERGEAGDVGRFELAHELAQLVLCLDGAGAALLHLGNWRRDRFSAVLNVFDFLQKALSAKRSYCSRCCFRLRVETRSASRTGTAAARSALHRKQLGRALRSQVRRFSAGLPTRSA